MNIKRIITIILLCVFVIIASTSLSYGRTRIVVRQSDEFEKVFLNSSTDYIIKDDIDLQGRTIQIGPLSTLVFRGGSLSNGTLIGNNTRIKAKNYEILKRGYTRFRAYKKEGESDNNPPLLAKKYYQCIIIEGTWNNKKCGNNWTGLLNESREDVMLPLKNYIMLHKSGRNVILPHIKAFGYESTRIPANHFIDFNNSSIDYPDNLDEWEDMSIKIPDNTIPYCLESGYGLLTLGSNTIIKDLSINGKSNKRQEEQLRLGVSCIIAIGNADIVKLDNVRIADVLGPGVAVQASTSNLIFENCSFRNIGEHIIYSHQYKGFCYFHNCTFDTWDSERLSLYRQGMDYVYKHSPPTDGKTANYDEMYGFDLQFNDCIFSNPNRITSQGRTLGGFITGDFPVVVKLNRCKFIGAMPVLNPGGGPAISEKTGMNWRMIVKNCDGAPYVYPSKSNYNIITEFYDCVNIPFRVVYAKRYERCVMYYDVYEDNIENVSSLFVDEFAEPLVVKECELVDKGTSTIINHPLFHRPIKYINSRLSDTGGRVSSLESLTVNKVR